MKRLCVFCGSSPGVRPAYRQAAESLARCLASRGIGIVYGGSHVGLMGALADAALAGGGEVIGVIPRSLSDKELAHAGLTRLHVVDTLHARKARMAELADGFMALPGGFGTFDELCEALTWTQLGLQRKPCGLLNVEGYFDPLLQMFDRAVTEKFLKPAHRQMVLAEAGPEALLARMLAWEAPVVEKWLGRGDA